MDGIRSLELRALAVGGREPQSSGFNAPPPPVPPYTRLTAALSSLQPGKLTEAFKYFIQGMGYSKSTHAFSADAAVFFTCAAI